MKKQTGYTSIELIVALFCLTLAIGCGGGWLMNVYKLTECDFNAPYKAEIIRIVGVAVPPVGVVVGWMDIED